MSSTQIECKAPRFGAVANITVWLRALRPESFPVSVVPALLGVAIAWEEGYRIDPVLAALTLVGAIAIHAATNLLQDYFDFKNGLDREGTLGGSGVLVNGLRSPRSILIASIVFFFLSAVLAGYLIHMRGMTLAWIVGAGLVLGAGYAVPRYGLKYNLLGDVGVFAAFGIGITVGAYFVQTGSLSWYPIVYAVPFGLIVLALLHANNMRDADDDCEVGLKNPAYRMGVRFSRAFYAFLILGAYALLVGAVLLGLISRGALIVLLTFPLGLGLVSTALKAGTDDKAVLGPLVVRTALLALAFGMAMVIGIVGYGMLSS